jgi:hypothetical protein
VVVATFAEESVVNNAVNVELVEEWVTVLNLLVWNICLEEFVPTFDTDAVKTTTS